MSKILGFAVARVRYSPNLSVSDILKLEENVKRQAALELWKFVRIEHGLDYEIIGRIWACDPRDANEQRPPIEANARLIAACPEMLAALQDLRDYFGPLPDTDNGLDELLGNARAAIAKATGED